MKNTNKYDFGGYATKVNVQCTDGRTIMKDAFKHCDGKTVPLVYQHLHNGIDNILGKALLEHRDDGLYAYCTFNSTPAGKVAKSLVEHGDITSLSIFANQLKEQAKQVIHGAIVEVSLVLAGANPGAKIDNLEFAHGDGTSEFIAEEVIISYGEPIALLHSSEPVDPEPTATPDPGVPTNSFSHSDPEPTVQSVWQSMSEDQQTLVFGLLGNAISNDKPSNLEHSNTIKGEPIIMKNNVFDNTHDSNSGILGTTLQHDQIQSIITDAKRSGSLKESFLSHAETYGLNPIDILFPEARALNNEPEMIKRDDEWVSNFLGAIRKNPFSRIKSVYADITEDEARAKGYITGKKKKEEIIPLLKRVTTPTTIYKKQKLDRDDVIDITDFAVVAWLKGEMRVMLNEEMARAIIVGDGRDISSEDHISESNIRPVWTDADLYCTKVAVPENTTTIDMIDKITAARRNYKGSSNPNFYSTSENITNMLLVRDTTNRRIYPTLTDLASALRVKDIIEVEVMENCTRQFVDPDTSAVENRELIGIILNPRDYTIGADKGGEVSMFEDFDIDFNQNKYLIETRISGALTKPKSAVAIERKITTTPPAQG